MVLSWVRIAELGGSIYLPYWTHFKVEFISDKIHLWALWELFWDSPFMILWWSKVKCGLNKKKYCFNNGGRSVLKLSSEARLGVMGLRVRNTTICQLPCFFWIQGQILSCLSLCYHHQSKMGLCIRCCQKLAILLFISSLHLHYSDAKELWCAQSCII